MTALEPRISARDAKAWRKWLERNHASAREVWLVFSRQHTGQACVGYEEAVEEALCFGWIDGIKKRVDEDHYAYRFSPRQQRSRWSPSARGNPPAPRPRGPRAAPRRAAAGNVTGEGTRRGARIVGRSRRPCSCQVRVH